MKADSVASVNEAELRPYLLLTLVYVYMKVEKGRMRKSESRTMMVYIVLVVDWWMISKQKSLPTERGSKKLPFPSFPSRSTRSKDVPSFILYRA